MKIDESNLIDNRDGTYNYDADVDYDILQELIK